MFAKTLMAVAILCFAVLSLIGIPASAKRIQDQLQREGTNALARANLHIDSLRFSGRDAFLDGTVDSEEMKVMVEKITESVSGVRVVANRLQVVARQATQTPTPEKRSEPKQPASPETAKKLIERQIRFQSNSSVFTADDIGQAEELVAILQQHPSVRIEISGHTDDVGVKSSNIRLSSKRAEAIRTFLIESGIEASRLKATGFGESMPIADNTTEAGRAQNRRVEIRVLD